MRRFDRWAIWLLLGYGLCGCTRTSEVKTSEKTAFQQELKGRERDRSTEVVQTGPETVTTTIEEFATAIPEVVSEGDSSGVPTTMRGSPAEQPRESGNGSLAARPGRVGSGATIIVKRTVTVDQRGPVVATKTEVATKVESASLTEKQEKASDTKKKTSYWPPPWLILAGLVLLGLGGWALKRGVKIASL